VINKLNEPVQAAAGSEERKRVISYLDECCASEKFAVRMIEPMVEAGLPEGSVQNRPSVSGYAARGSAT